MTAHLSLAHNLFGSLVDHSPNCFWIFQHRKMEVGRVVAAAPNFFASACSMAGGSMRSFAEMITHEDFVFHAATVSSSSNNGP
jgi:hypothetical protein